MNLDGHLPALLARARALLHLPGGPDRELGKRELPRAAEAVLALHAGLVGDRTLARPGTYQGAHLGAYLLWWWPQTYAKTRAALRMAPMPQGPRILDLGAGPAPAAIAALDELGGTALAVDASAAALDEARALAKAGVHGELRVQQGDLLDAGCVGAFDRTLVGAFDRTLAGAFDLTLAANVLLELPAERRAALVRGLPGVVVLIEPALRETGRALLELRDLLLADGSFRALAPCLTQRPCPALLAPKDWCTAEVRWQAPRHVVQLAEATGLRADELLSFAPLILAREAPAPAADLWRVVGVPPSEKGKKRLFVCSDQGRLAVARLDKHAGPENAQLDDLRRGDRVRLTGAEPRGDGLRLVPGATVERVE